MASRIEDDDDDGYSVRSAIKVQLIGDCGVGKTSLLLSFMNDHFFDVSSPDVHSLVHDIPPSSNNNRRHSVCNIDVDKFDHELPSSVNSFDLCYSVVNNNEMEMFNEDFNQISDQESYYPFPSSAHHSCSFVDDVFIPGKASTTGTPCIIRDQPMLLTGQHNGDSDEIVHVLDCPTSKVTMRDIVLDADVICLVYAVGDPSCTQQVTPSQRIDFDVDSKSNVLRKWIPFLVQCFTINDTDDESDISGNGAPLEPTKLQSTSGVRCRRGCPKPVLIICNRFEPTQFLECNPWVPDHVDQAFSCSPDLPMSKLMTAYSWICYWLDCSAVTMHNVAEVFYYAQKCVFYPPVPIFDSTSLHLEQPALQAIERVFTILDRSQIGYLDSDTIMQLQSEIFRCWCCPISTAKLFCEHDIANWPSGGTQLPRGINKQSYKSDLLPSSYDMLRVRRLLAIRQKCPVVDGTSNLCASKFDHKSSVRELSSVNQGLTKAEFVSLFCLLIEHDLWEPVWTLMRIFFDNNLEFSCPNVVRLQQDLSSIPDCDIPDYKNSMELRTLTLNFLVQLYRLHAISLKADLHWPTSESIRQNLFRCLSPGPNTREMFHNVFIHLSDESSPFSSNRSQGHPADEAEAKKAFVSEERFLLWWLFRFKTDCQLTLKWIDQLGFEFWQLTRQSTAISPMFVGVHLQHPKCSFKLRKKMHWHDFKSPTRNLSPGSTMSCVIQSYSTEAGSPLVQNATSLNKHYNQLASHYPRSFIARLNASSWCSRSRHINVIFNCFNPALDNRAEQEQHSVDGCGGHEKQTNNELKSSNILLSHALILLCDVRDSNSVQQVLNLCHTLEAEQTNHFRGCLSPRQQCFCGNGIDVKACSPTVSSQSESPAFFRACSDTNVLRIGPQMCQHHSPLFLIIAFNADLCEGNDHLEGIRRIQQLQRHYETNMAAMAPRCVILGSNDRVDIFEIVRSQLDEYTDIQRAIVRSSQVDIWKGHGITSNALSYIKLNAHLLFSRTQSLLRSLCTTSTESNRDWIDDSLVSHMFQHPFAASTDNRECYISSSYCIFLSSSAIFGFIIILLARSFYRRSYVVVKGGNLTKSMFS